MEKHRLPFDTAKYDDLPVGVFIYEPIRRADGSLLDYRVVYGNAAYALMWEKYVPDRDWYGAGVCADMGLDDEARDVLRRFSVETPRTFSAYAADAGIHASFTPLTKLPAPYGGFLVTDISRCEEGKARSHFLHAIRQMENAAVLFRKETDGTVKAIFASDAFARLMGCTPEAALRLMDGEGYLERTHPSDREAVRAMLETRVSKQGTKELTIRRLTAKGATVWCSIHYAFIDDYGEHYIYCTYTDVTVSTLYAQRLRATYIAIGESFYRENARTLGMFRVNLTQDHIEDMRGRDLFDTDSTNQPYSMGLRKRADNYPIARDRERFLKGFSRSSLLEAYAAGTTRLSDRFFSRRKDGTLCYVEFTALLTRHPIFDSVMAFISEQEANEEKVEHALLDKILARQFDMVAFIANGRYGVVVGDAALIEKGSLFPKERAGDYESYLAAQVLPVLDGDEETRAEMAASLRLENVRDGVREDAPYIVNIACRIDGAVYYKRFYFYAVDPEAAFYILLKSDTTAIQMKQMEQNAQLTEALREARQASVAKTAFLSRMSHEIRTPMNAIIGLDNIALHEKGMSPQLKDHLEKIGQSARYLLSLINDILDMSRIESGRMTLRNEEFSFRSFLEQINTMVDSQCRDRGLSYDCHVRGELCEFYIGDDTKLKQVLINILGNAVKFTPQGGHIDFTAECATRYEGQSSFVFRVKDTGIGMDREYLPRIFEAFSQEDGTTMSSYGGSGLGMAITKNLVEMMNGTITVESEKGVGTEFIVAVPLKESRRRQTAGEDGIRPQDLSVLVIDDEELAQGYARSVLEDAGVAADVCGSGREALEMIRLRHARSEAYNVILVDLRMPEQDGVEVTREIRKVLGDKAAVIILTAYDWSDVEEAAVEAGVDAFMAKPLIASGVLYEVQQAFLRKQANQEEETPADLTGRRILLAEDMLVNAEIMKELLSMMGMEAEHAENGKLAVEMLASHPAGYYDAILMDVRMPVMDELKATETIRALDHPDAETIPIIAMTANAFDEDVQRSLRAGMNAHLAKPVEPERMFKTLSEMIGRRERQKASGGAK